MGEARRRGSANAKRFYHVTTPEIAPVILAEGFKDGVLGKIVEGKPVAYRSDDPYTPGVWLADVPPITCLPVDYYLAREDEAWIAVEVNFRQV